MSVWVCMGYPLVYGENAGKKSGEPYPKEQCSSYNKGECDISGKPCDAVEYAPVKSQCKWTQTPDGQYETSCGQIFEFTNDGPKENGFTHCPYCGCKMEENG